MIKIKAATYNIHRCIGTDGKMDMGRIVAVLKEIDADLVGIQEIDSHHIDEGGHQLNYLAKHTGYHVAAGPTLWRSDGEYGNAFLSRFPIKVLRRMDLSSARREPRGALDVDLDIQGIHCRVITTHLGLKWRERKFQLGKIFEGVTVSSRHPLIIMGDMNEWLPFMGATRIFRSQFGFVPRILSYPSFFPVFPLDQIYICPSSYLVSAGVHVSKLSRVASDHLPVAAEIRLPLLLAKPEPIEYGDAPRSGAKPSAPIPR
ncbi:MAG TPA: endonuclease/exonuclease/phosphatase family protein [Bdellovibrionales bacterium]|nr:endonuclease/exonuclease/phosphatase family protein [Bdellovibrionales bacterium]